jgi:hypothetical protein
MSSSTSAVAAFTLPREGQGDNQGRKGEIDGERAAEAEAEWFLEAEKLSDAFRETRALFSGSRSVPFQGMFPGRRRRKRNEEYQRRGKGRTVKRKMGRGGAGSDAVQETVGYR